MVGEHDLVSNWPLTGFWLSQKTLGLVCRQICSIDLPATRHEVQSLPIFVNLWGTWTMLMLPGRLQWGPIIPVIFVYSGLLPDNLKPLEPGFSLTLEELVPKSTPLNTCYPFYTFRILNRASYLLNSYLVNCATPFSVFKLPRSDAPKFIELKQLSLAQKYSKYQQEFFTIMTIQKQGNYWKRPLPKNKAESLGAF